MNKQSQTTWNHRILAHKESPGTQFEETIYAIHEVYTKDGKLSSYAESPVNLSATSTEGLKWTLDRMRECLEKPILDRDNFPEEWKEE